MAAEASPPTRFGSLKGLPQQQEPSADRLREIRGLPQPEDDPTIAATQRLQQLESLRAQGTPALDEAISSLREQLTSSQAGRVALVYEEQSTRVSVAEEAEAERGLLLSQAPKPSEDALAARLAARGAGGKVAAMQQAAESQPGTVPAPEDAQPVTAAPAPTPARPQTPRSKARALAERVRGGDAAANIRWQKGGILGKGSFGEVIRGVTTTGRIIAVKQISLRRGQGGDMAEKETEAICLEVQLMRNLKHPNIVEYLGTDFDEEGSNLLILMEFADGGTLSGLVKGLPNVLEEETAAMFMRHTLLGVEFLHQNGVVHRDIKGANILLTSRDGVCKLADFGCSKSIQDLCGATRGCETMVGTPYWMAPEVIMAQQDGASYGKASDIWSVGCTACEILNKGAAPWPEFPNMWSAVYHIANATGPPSAMPTQISESARDFIMSMCRRAPRERATAGEALSHQFLAGAAATLASTTSGQSPATPLQPPPAAAATAPAAAVPPPAAPTATAPAAAPAPPPAAPAATAPAAAPATAPAAAPAPAASPAPPLSVSPASGGGLSSIPRSDGAASQSYSTTYTEPPPGAPGTIGASGLADDPAASVGSVAAGKRGSVHEDTPASVQVRRTSTASSPKSGDGKRPSMNESALFAHRSSGDVNSPGASISSVDASEGKPCTHCGRMFPPSSVQRHENICPSRPVPTPGKNSWRPPGDDAAPPPGALTGGAEGASESVASMGAYPEEGEKLYPCEHCPRTFRAEVLARHMPICATQKHRDNFRRGNTPAKPTRPKSSGGRQPAGRRPK